MIALTCNPSSLRELQETFKGFHSDSSSFVQIWTAILLNHSIKFYGIMEKD
jgi:hypothetical protein